MFSLEARRPDGVGHAADVPPAVMGGPRHGDPRQRLARVELDADQLAVDARSAQRLERLLADVVLRLLLDQPLEARDVKRRVGEREVGAAVEDAGLDPPGLVRGDRPDRELLAGRHDRVPHLVAARPVEQVHLEPGHRRPAGPGDDDRDARRSRSGRTSSSAGRRCPRRRASPASAPRAAPAPGTGGRRGRRPRRRDRAARGRRARRGRRRSRRAASTTRSPRDAPAPGRSRSRRRAPSRACTCTA